MSFTDADAPPNTFATDAVELTALGASVGLAPWSPVALRALGPIDAADVTPERCAAALVRLVDRGLIVETDDAADPGDGTEADSVAAFHPVGLAAIAVLATATHLVERSTTEAPVQRWAYVVAPAGGGLLINASGNEPLLVTLVDADVTLDDAIRTLEQADLPDGAGPVEIVGLPESERPRG